MGLAEPRVATRPVLRVIIGGRAPRASVKPYLEALDSQLREASETQLPVCPWSLGEMVE